MLEPEESALPELPEVETVVRELRRMLRGRRLLGVQVLDTRLLDHPEFPPSKSIGCLLRDVQRRAKYVALRFEQGGDWILHLRMTGRLLPEGSAALPPRRGADDRSRRLVLDFDGQRMWFYDVRRFGTLTTCADADRYFARLGIAPEFTEPDTAAQAEAHLRAALARSRRTVKAALLDQTVVAGIGNIYADESLHAAGIHPERTGATLKEAEVDRLLIAIRRVLAAAIRARGSTVSDFRGVDGQPGDYARSLRVYGRTGLPCQVCDRGMIVRLRVAGRSTHLCPRCQPRQRSARSSRG